jgi:sarcosine oxidase
MSSHEVIVVGLGAHGSATLFQLANRGVDVVGIDRFDPPHEMGSTHGESRGSYEAGAFGSAHHAPFSRRTIELWRELEAETGQQLFFQRGILIMGPSDSDMVRKTREASVKSNAMYEELDPDSLRARFPAFTPGDDTISIFQPRGGYMLVAPIVREYLRLARARGATIRTNERVISWRADGGGVEVTTARDLYHADKLIFTAGAFLPALVSDLPVQINAERQTLGFWKAKTHAELFSPERLPVWCCEVADHNVVFGVPDLGSGIKLGVHLWNTVTDPETLDRAIADADIELMRSLLGPVMPDALGNCQRGMVCLYTVTPDYEFIVDRHPAHENVIIGCICNSQGFKYSAAFGETLASLALTGTSQLDVSPWAFTRFV